MIWNQNQINKCPYNGLRCAVVEAREAKDSLRCCFKQKREKRFKTPKGSVDKTGASMAPGSVWLYIRVVYCGKVNHTVVNYICNKIIDKQSEKGGRPNPSFDPVAKY